MDRQIILSDEKKREITDTFGYSRQTVWAALHYKTKSPVANMIRKAALERGGILIGETKCPDGITPHFETVFHTAENLMVQTFSDRVKLVADLTTGLVTVYTDEEVVDTYDNPQITELSAIQQNVQHLANQFTN
ncbi:hypothetical protein [Parabacteroides sp. PF5-9]|uniref:hypothetical protein n=1 Tax=Parabacteroides sp. PF5-9 TaxID=1742404 RepID=UPI002473DA49|nr:hypothetical protein [Parabacteroides sp. PF5-9]MDH6357213.1 hypothetical protein [Parabacteroides sp. PF5-9]